MFGEKRLVWQQGVDGQRIITDLREIVPGGNLARLAEGVGLNTDALEVKVAALTMQVLEEIQGQLGLDPLAQLKDSDMAAFAGAVPEMVFRTDDQAIQLQMFQQVMDGTGIPEGLNGAEKLGLRIAHKLPLAFQKIMQVVRYVIRKRIGGFVQVFPTDDADKMIDQLDKDSAETGMGYIANLVTEAAITKQEAFSNKLWYLNAVKKGAQCVTIKPTALVPLSTAAVSYQRTKNELRDALTEIFAAADAYQGPDGFSQTEINVDSERSDLLLVTRDAFIEASRKYPKVKAKIVLQAYLADTEEKMFNPLADESEARFKKGDYPLGARVVCGANMPGENDLAKAKGWVNEAGEAQTPILDSRTDTHANYMRLMHVITDLVNEGKFTVTVASMNLFTIMHNLAGLAQAGVFAGEHGGYVSFAMLKGMTGPGVFKYLAEKYGVQGMEYVPVISQDRLVELFKYYLRRLDELVGTTEEGKVENYVGVLAKFGSASQRFQDTQLLAYLEAVALNNKQETKETVYPLQPRISSYRGDNEPLVIPQTLTDFRPAPSANFGAEADRKWGEEMLAQVQWYQMAGSLYLPAAVGGNGSKDKVTLSGPAFPERELFRYESATVEDVDKAFEVCQEDLKGWAEKPMQDRLGILQKVVEELRSSRNLMLRALVLNIAKSLPEADAEVNEAMDFANLTRLHTAILAERDNLEIKPGGDGTAVVICPKNFPNAIPLAQILARLAAGYRVIVKPSGGEGEETVWATWEMVRALYEAGVPREALIFLPCDNQVAAHMTKKAERGNFTGSTAVAQKINEANSHLDLIAETGGRNVIVLDSTSDLKEVAQITVESICGFAGQKCSKPIAILCTGDVDLEKFKGYLREVMSLQLVTSPLTLHTDVTPLSKPREAGDKLYEQIMNLRDGEEWLTEAPKQAGDPAIRFVSDASSYDFAGIEEIFAPIATVLQIDGGIEQAVEMINDLPGTLTGSFFSQDRAAIVKAIKGWQTGNLYINDGPTGCLAHQGFGDGPGDAHRGMPGVKTGTIEYAIANAHITRKEGVYAEYDLASIKPDAAGIYDILQKLESFRGRCDNLKAIVEAGYSYLYEYQRHYGVRRMAPYELHGQKDWLESRPNGKQLICCGEGMSSQDLIAKIMLAKIAGNAVEVLAGENAKEGLVSVLGIEITNSLLQGVDFLELGEVEFRQLFAASKYGCIHYLGEKPSDELAVAAVEANLYIDRRPVTGDGLVDLLTQFRQQSIAYRYAIAGDSTYEQMRDANGVGIFDLLDRA